MRSDASFLLNKFNCLGQEGSKKEQWCADKVLEEKALLGSICQFLWYKYYG